MNERQKSVARMQKDMDYAGLPVSGFTVWHAAVAALVLCATVFLPGFRAFWNLFLHGTSTPLTPTLLIQNLIATAVLFGGLAFFLWLSTHPFRRRVPRLSQLKPKGNESQTATENLTQTEHGQTTRSTPEEGNGPMTATRPAAEECSGPTGGENQNETGWARRRKAIRMAARWALYITPLAILIHLAAGQLIKHATGIEPADQMLVSCFTDGQYALSLRLVLMMAVVLQAPLLEEYLFRGILFRGLAQKLPFAWAALLSGFVFAFVHVNAASFLALWFLGIVFAALYRRTGTLLAPMCAHALFNTANLILLLLFPEAAH